MKTGEELRDEGIHRAVEAADVGWKDEAYGLLKEFAKNAGTFLVEDARAYAKGKGLADPPSKRAWGGIIRKAKKEGFVKQVGYSQVTNPLAHRANASVWQAAW